MEDTEPSRSDTPGLPPTYEQALGHRRIEYSTLAPIALDPTHAEQRSTEARLSHTSRLSTRTGSHDTDEDTSTTSTTDRDLDEGCVRLLLPPMHICIATICLFSNILVPGLGTLLASVSVFCCTRRREWSCSDKLASFCCSVTIALLQILLTPILLIGWIWSILWGFALVAISQQEYHGIKPASVSPAADIHTVQMPAPPSYNEATSTPAPTVAIHSSRRGTQHSVVTIVEPMTSDVTEQPPEEPPTSTGSEADRQIVESWHQLRRGASSSSTVDGSNHEQGHQTVTEAFSGEDDGEPAPRTTRSFSAHSDVPAGSQDNLATVSS